MAGTSSSAGGRRGAIVGINVTPMVDVVLVLLVIMMVSATYVVAQSLKVELPKAAASDGSVPSTAVVTVGKDGALSLNRERVELAELRPKLRALKAKDKDVSLVVSADRDAAHGRVVEVIDAAKLEGIAKFALQTEKPR